MPCALQIDATGIDLEAKLLHFKSQKSQPCTGVSTRMMWLVSFHSQNSHIIFPILAANINCVVKVE